jgi:Flp pilus assembly protein TadD
MEEKRFPEALAEARAVLRERPTHAEAKGLAQAAEAEVVLEECIANATAALEAGDRERALAEVRRGFAIRPNDTRLVDLFRRATQ